jgi:hypothetical protein
VPFLPGEGGTSQQEHPALLFIAGHEGLRNIFVVSADEMSG